MPPTAVVVRAAEALDQLKRDATGTAGHPDAGGATSPAEGRSGLDGLCRIR
jgi:hypothetical protein